MNARATPATFDVLRAHAFIRGENTLAVVCDQPFDTVGARLEASIVANHLALLHVHEIDRTLLGAGIELGHRSRDYEVCNAELAAQLLRLDPGLAHALPSRIAMHGHGGVVTVCTPMPIIAVVEFSHAAPVARVARLLEANLQRVLRGIQ